MTRYASDPPRIRGILFGGVRRRPPHGGRRPLRQTTPYVLAVRRPCPSIVPWWRRRTARWPFPVGCTSHRDHGRGFRSTLLSAWDYCSSSPLLLLAAAAAAVWVDPEDENG